MNIDDIDQGDVLWLTDLRRGVTSAVTVIEVDDDRVFVIDEDGTTWRVAAGFLSRH